VGAGSVVRKDVPDFALVVGNPAKQIGWMSQYGERLVFQDEIDGMPYAKCPHTGSLYQLIDNVVLKEIESIKE
jgi:UDP-2-acetamido-3-amino-2,3-dideoxy-glucuronate N-acetyltransferase